MSQSSAEGQGLNPNWKPLLDKLPESFHPLITPILADWDKGQQDKLQQVRTEAEKNNPLQQFSGLPPELIGNALSLWQAFENHPEKVVEQAISDFKLDYTPNSQIQQQSGEENEYDEFLGNGQQQVDIANHPVVKELMSRLEEVQGSVSEREQADATAQAVRQHEQWLKEMQDPEKFGPFNTTYVTALMSQGVDGEEAIKQYQQEIANAIAATGTNTQQQTQQTTGTPELNIMGGDGAAGSGVEGGEVNFSAMPKTKFNDMVADLITASQQSQQ